MNIGTNLRRLRREKDLTQEELADILGVSFQAVSKWERGDSYPDITALPGIASFFKVSVDALLGMDAARRAEEIEEIHRLALKKLSEGTPADMAAVYREALKKYPNEDSLLKELANSLTGYRKGDTGGSPEEAREAADIWARILKYSTDDFMRDYARASLPYAYFLADEREKAVEAANKLPDIRFCRDGVLIEVTRGEAQIKAIQSLLHEFMYIFWQTTRFAAPRDTYIVDTDGDFFGYAAQERIGILEIGIKALELMSDAGDYPYFPIRAAFNYRAMAVLALSAGLPEQSLDYLERAADYAVMNDTLPEAAEYRSALRNRLGPVIREHACACHQLLIFLEKDCFDALRRNERFLHLIGRLAVYAPEYETPAAR